MLESRTDGALEVETAPVSLCLSARGPRRSESVQRAGRLGPLSLAIWSAVLLSLSSCTATQSLLQCRRANAALQRVGPVTTPAAIYELTRARAYLDKAREEAAEAHYGLSIELAQNAERAAVRAIQAHAARPGGRL